MLPKRSKDSFYLTTVCEMFDMSKISLGTQTFSTCAYIYYIRTYSRCMYVYAWCDRACATTASTDSVVSSGL